MFIARRKTSAVRPVNLPLNTKKSHLKSALHHSLLFNDVKQFTLVTPFVKRVASFLSSLPPGGELILPHFGLRATNSAVVAHLDAAKGDADNMFDRVVLGECKPNTKPASVLHVFLCISKELEIEHKAISTVPNDGTGRHRMHATSIGNMQTPADRSKDSVAIETGNGGKVTYHNAVMKPAPANQSGHRTLCYAQSNVTATFKDELYARMTCECGITAFVKQHTLLKTTNTWDKNVVDTLFIQALPMKKMFLWKH